MSIQVKDISYKHGEQAKLFSSFTAKYNYHLENMRNNNKISTKFEIVKIELEEKLKMEMDRDKSETPLSIDIKLLTLNSNKFTSYYNQPSSDLIKWPLLKTPKK